MANKRQQIIDGVITRLKLINGAGSYNLNLGSRVYDNRATPFADEECPAINVQDLTEEKNQELLSGASNVWYRDLTINVQLISNGTLAPENIRKGISDIERAIGTDLTWSAIAIDTDWIGTTKQIDQEELKIMSATVVIKILFSTSQWSES